MSTFLDPKSNENIIAGWSIRQKKTLMFKHSEIIDNLNLQIAENCTKYRLRDNSRESGKGETPLYCIWSLFDSCGMAGYRADGNPILLVGNQGDFVLE